MRRGFCTLVLFILPVAIVHVPDRNALVDRLLFALVSVVVAVTALATVVPAVARVAHTDVLEILNWPIYSGIGLSPIAHERDRRAVTSAKAISTRSCTRDIWYRAACGFADSLSYHRVEE